MSEAKTAPMDKWEQHKRVQVRMGELDALAMRGMRMGVARGVPGAAMTLALLRHHTDGRLCDSEAVVRAVRDDMRVVGGMSNGEELAYLLSPLDAMLDTPGARCGWRHAGDASAEECAGVCDALGAAARRVREVQAAEPVSRDFKGRPRVCLLDMIDGRWHAASVARITPRQIKLAIDRDAREVVLKRDKGYPAVGDAPWIVDAFEIDHVLREAGQMFP